MRRLLVAGICLASAKAQCGDILGVFQAPPNPSSDLKTFKRQLIFHNTNILVRKAGESDGSVRTVAAVAKEARGSLNNLQVYTKKEGEFTVKTGANLQKGIVTGTLGYEKVAWVNTVDLVGNCYTASYQYKGASFNYTKPKAGAQYFNIAYGMGW